MPEVDQNSVDSDFESDFQAYLRQKALNAALTTSAVISSIWFAVGVVVLGVGILAQPAADTVGMDPAGREHRLSVMTIPTQAPGAKR